METRRSLNLVLIISIFILISCSGPGEDPSSSNRIDTSGTTTDIDRGENQSNGSNHIENGWIEYLTSSGKSVQAFYNHPQSESRLPAIIYNHGRIVETDGYEGAVNQGYDVTDFVNAIAQQDYVGIAPIRPVGSFAEDGIFSATIQILKDQENVDPERIFMIGFSRGGLLTLQYTLS